MGIVGDYLGSLVGAGANKVVGTGIEVTNKVLDLGSQWSVTKPKVDQIRSDIHAVEKWLTGDQQVRPQGTNGGDIYTWFHHGPDPQSKDLQSAVKGWNKVSEYHEEASDALNKAMSKIKTNWEGQAADGAANNTEPLRQSAETAHEQSKQSAGALQGQADGFHDTKNRVVQMESEPPVISIKEQFTGNNTFDRRVNQYTEGQHANQQAYSGYGNTTQTNVQAVPNFQPPPEKPAQPGENVQPGNSMDAKGSHVSPSSGESAGTSSSSVDGARPGPVPGARPSHPSVPQPGQNPNSPAPNQPSFHFQRPGTNDQQPDRSGIGAGMAAGGAGAVAGGGAIAGGSLLGGSAGGGAGGRGSGMSGRGLGQEAGGSSGAGRGAPGPGGQSGSGGSSPGGSGGGAATTGAGARGGAGGMGAAPVGAGAGGRKEDDQHERPDYLTEANPHAVFGLEERVAPPVLGDRDND